MGKVERALGDERRAAACFADARAAFLEVGATGAARAVEALAGRAATQTSSSPAPKEASHA